MMDTEAFQITDKDKKTKARVGILQTKHGPIETPFFMPVATKASVKYLSTKDLEAIGVPATISNMFVLSMKPGAKLIKKMGGLRTFMNYSGVTATDSGGFQMYSKKCYIGSTEKGVRFRNPFNNEEVFISPEKDMEYQLAIDADIAMCLDSMPLLEHSKAQIEEAVRKTALWAKRCRIHHTKLQTKLPPHKRQLLFGICQGGIYSDLRKQSAQELTSIGFDGYSLGGLALGESKEDEYRCIEVQKSIIPENKIVYLMGAGHPVEILEAISRGVDMFDSRFPTQNARRGTLFTFKGKVRLTNAEFVNDKRPIEPGCKCLACTHYSRAYLRYQITQEEGNGYRLVSYHNIYFLTRLLEGARAAIKNGTFPAYKSKIKKVFDRSDEKARANFKLYN